MDKSRNNGIDFLRGILIILVIIGHIMLGSIHENWVRYSIYAFHMPLFIGLTGYLLNTKMLIESSFVNVCTRYWWRVIVPFGCAFVFFTGILLWHAYQEGRVTHDLILSYLHTPYYHLWFIPTLVLWVLAYRMILKVKVTLLFVVFVFSLISLYWACVPKAEQLSIFSQLVSKKVIYFFSFFLFGAWLRAAAPANIKRFVWQFRWIFLGMIVILQLVYLSHIGVEKSAIRGITWFTLNVLLIMLAIPWFIAMDINYGYVSSVIVAIGRNSLPIYLWHVVPLFLLKGFDMHQTQPLFYYICGIVVTIIIVWFVLQFEARNKVVNCLVYGS